jgi:thioredoxin-dependent peroxiredoxin
MPQLAVGDLAPDFTLPASGSGSISLTELRDSPIVIFFFPAAMTPGCTLEATDFRDLQPQLTDAGYQLIGISPDPVAKLEHFAKTQNLTYPLASDVDREVLRAYGAWGAKRLYGKVIEGVLRSTVVVGPDGLVTLARYNVRATGHVGRLQGELGIT